MNMRKPIEIVVENLKRGSEQAKEFIFINHYQDFLKIANRIVKSKEDAEDVVSEAMFKMFNRIHQLKDPAQFLSWCRRIVVRDCYTFVKNRKVDSDLDVYDIRVYDDFTKAFDIYLIKNMITRLPLGYSRIIQLHCVEGYTGPEIGKMLGIDPGTVRSQLFKGRKMLQRRLGYEY